MKVHVQVERKEDTTYKTLVIKKGRHKLKVRYPNYTPEGEIFDIEFEGREAVLPSLAEVLALVESRRIDRIGTIDVVTLIKLIEEIRTIGSVGSVGSVGSLDAIRDLTHRPPELVVNPSFEEDLVGWQKYGSPSIDETISKYGSKSVKFPKDIVSWIRQVFPIPLSVDWFTEIMCWIRTSDAAANAFYVTYYYTDDSFSYETFSTTAGNAFQRKTLSPTSGKYLEVVQFEHLAAYSRDSWLDAILTVF